MRAHKKLTKEQIKGLLEFVAKAEQMPSKFRELKFLYNPNTPEDVYAKFLGYQLEGDNGILVNEEVVCIKNNGELTDCFEQFGSLREKMAFSADFIEFDIDKNGRIRFV
jgi:hypothetical protein